MEKIQLPLRADTDITTYTLPPCVLPSPPPSPPLPFPPRDVSTVPQGPDAQFGPTSSSLSIVPGALVSACPLPISRMGVYFKIMDAAITVVRICMNMRINRVGGRKGRYMFERLHMNR